MRVLLLLLLLLFRAKTRHVTDLAVTVFRRAKANRCARSELTQTRRGRCYKRQPRRKVIKRRMYNYRKRGTNEPTVTMAYGELNGHVTDDHVTLEGQSLDPSCLCLETRVQSRKQLEMR